MRFYCNKCHTDCKFLLVRWERSGWGLLLLHATQHHVATFRRVWITDRSNCTVHRRCVLLYVWSLGNGPLRT
jgi:hypothetical protein